MRVFSGPMLASETAATTLTLAGNALTASVAGPFHAVEPGDGARGNEDAAAVLLGQARPLVQHADEPAHREDHEVLAPRQAGRAELAGGGLRRGRAEHAG